MGGAGDVLGGAPRVGYDRWQGEIEENKMRRAWWLLAAVAVVVSSWSCAGRNVIPRIPPPDEMSPKLNPFVYFEEGTTLFVGVDTRAARYVEDGTIFPLGLGLSNVWEKSLTVGREDIVLEDDAGNRYPLVSLEEFNRDYRRSRTDARLLDSFVEAVGGRYSNFDYTPWRLFPFKGETSTSTDTIELGRFNWTVGYLYFPIPEGGVKDRSFALLVETREVPETFVVRFTVE